MDKCCECDNNAVYNRTRCDYHLKLDRERAKRRRDKFKNSNLCNICHAHPKVVGRSSCERCINYQREWQKNKRHKCKENKICISCGKPITENKTHCSRCQGFCYGGDITSKNGSIKGRALERDNYTCQICGHKENIHVHHIDGNGVGEEHPNHSIDNLITICSKCHKNIHSLKNKMNRTEYLDRILYYSLLLR